MAIEDILFIIWFIIVILCLIIEFNPRIKESITDLFIVDQIYMIKVKKFFKEFFKDEKDEKEK